MQIQPPSDDAEVGLEEALDRIQSSWDICPHVALFHSCSHGLSLNSEQLAFK